MTAASEAERAPEALVEVARDDVDRAVAAGVIRADQAEPLWRFLKEKPAAPDAAVRPRFDLVHLLWYAGALIVIGAMGLFTTLAFAQLGGAALAATAVIYAVILAVAGDRLWRRELLVPGGLLITIAVTMAPLFVYGMQDRSAGSMMRIPAPTAASTDFAGGPPAVGCRWPLRPSPAG